MRGWVTIMILLSMAGSSLPAEGPPGPLAQGATFFVAPGGDDAGPGSLEKPFASLVRARDAVRELRRAGKLAGSVTVVLRGGTYFLREPLALGPEDSGTAGSPVVYRAYEGEKLVLSGGQALAGWEQEEEGIYQVTLPEVREGKWAFRQLFVGKRDAFERRYRPTRGPFIIAGLTDSPTFKSTMRHRQSQRDFIFKPGDIDPGWANRGDIEVVALHDWSTSRMRIASIDAERHVVTFTGWPVYRIGHWYQGGRNPYFVENVKEAGLKPGEWYLDRPTGVLRYRPLPGEEMDKLTVVAPRAEQLVRLVGDAAKGQFVEHVEFRGIAFCHTGWALPPEGFSSGQGMIGLPAAFHAEFARDCRLERCDFAHLGAYAVRLGQGCQGDSVVGCRMFDLGAGGVLIGVTKRDAQPPVLPTGNRVENCVISDGGLVHFSPHGIWVGITQGTAIRHNVVRRFPYSNISVGWCWDDRPSAAGNTLIEANEICDAMMLLADGGAIYSLGWQPGNAIRANHIHDVRRSPFAGRAPNNGIFLDEGSKGFLIESNVIYACANGPIRHNRNKHDDHTWKDNVFDVRPGDPAFPAAAKAIVAAAGLEPAWRDLEPTPPARRLPLLTAKAASDTDAPQ